MNSLSILGEVCGQELSKISYDAILKNSKETQTENNYNETKDIEIISTPLKRKPHDKEEITPTAHLESALKTSRLEIPNSSALDLETTDLGDLEYKIKESEFCRFSKFTGWHLQSSCGVMKIDLKSEMLDGSDPLIIRATLVRRDETFRSFAINKICKKHNIKGDVTSEDNVLHSVPGAESFCYFDNTGYHNSICFNITKENLRKNECDNLSEFTIRLRSICNDTCNTSTDPYFKQTEKSRDLLLVLTLEDKKWKTILNYYLRQKNHK